MHCTENSKTNILRSETVSLVPNFYLHVSVSDLHTSMIGSQTQCSKNRCTDRGNIEIAHRYINWERGRAV